MIIQGALNAYTWCFGTNASGWWWVDWHGRLPGMESVAGFQKQRPDDRCVPDAPTADVRAGVWGNRFECCWLAVAGAQQDWISSAIALPGLLWRALTNNVCKETAASARYLLWRIVWIMREAPASIAHRGRIISLFWSVATGVHFWMENDTSVAKYLVGYVQSRNKKEKDITLLISSNRSSHSPLEASLPLCLPASRFQKISIPHPDNPEQGKYFANNPMLGSNSSWFLPSQHTPSTMSDCLGKDAK